MARIRTGNRMNLRRRGKGRRVRCEITNPINGGFIGWFNGTEDQLFDGGGCPCPNSNAILPGCCDLHDY
tara:strand:+ start:594 stop:800 length:207 start_codon:yes stop_codon:yes gene_type:complete